MKYTLLAATVAAFVTTGFPAVSSAASAAPAASATSVRQVVTQADQLPRRDVKLDKLPSEYLDLPLSSLQPVVGILERNLRADLDQYDIRDPATLREIYRAQASLAQMRGDWAAVAPLTARIRELQDKPGERAASGLLTELLAEQQLGHHDADWLGAQIQARYGALRWADVGDIVKSNRGSLQVFNPELLRGALQSQIDPVAINGKMHVSEDVAMAVISMRLQVALVGPNQSAIVSGLQKVIEANQNVAVNQDIWTPRTFVIPTDAKAAPVVVGIWDSGVDLALFKPAPERGMAFDEDARPSKELLHPLGDSTAAWPQLRGLIKGSMDLQAALDTPEAQRLRTTLSKLPASDYQAFSESLGLAGLHAHGTAVAGIAVDGNPFARVYAGTMLWSPRSEPALPTEARARATAASYQAMVDGFRRAGVRVVNMSWRYGPAAYEQALAFHNAGGSPEARRKEASRLFGIERDALRAAIAGAPDILFVAGSGNEDNNADFQEYIPAGLELPNLITVGASDRSGREATFSTFGKTVVVHANGFEVDCLVPGGEHLRLSGTSMASPQVANLAAKLLALKPGLSAVQVKRLIIDGADRPEASDGHPGRINLVNPRRSAALAGIAV